MPDLDAEPCPLVCTADGVFIWPGRAVVEKRGASFARVSDRDIANFAGALFGAEIIYGPLIPTLERTARFLECGQVTKAEEAIAKLKLPALTIHGEKLMQSAAASWRKEFDPDKHPRWPAGSPNHTGGEFKPSESDGAEDSASAPMQTAAGTLNECIESCYHLLDRWLPPGQFHKNEWDFQRCLADCRGKFG